MTPEKLLRMWLKDHAENRFGQAIACEQSYRSGKLASVADRMAAVHRAAGDVYAAALRALDEPADQPAPAETALAHLEQARRLLRGELERTTEFRHVWGYDYEAWFKAETAPRCSPDALSACQPGQGSK